MISVRRRKCNQFDVVCGFAEFADMTFEEFRDSRLMKGEQNCSATVGNHVLTGESLPKTVRRPLISTSSLSAAFNELKRLISR